jgi:predicted Ser/Thr protein kinase
MSLDFAPGQIVGDYEVLETLGAGGMGKVYKVRNTISERVEAMKVLLANLDEHPELVDRFGREIKVTASLEHPNIAGLRTALRIENQMAMVVEYVEGSGLDKLMKAGRLPLGQVIDVAHQALAALAYAHSRGVVHRDIKPGNIMLTADGRVKLMDFGIARMASDRQLTKTGQLVGSLYYMSPEQVEGKTPDARSDLYSLGVTLYEMATGRKPFEGDSEYSIMAGHLNETPRPPVELDPSLPASLNEVILLAMAKDPGARFQSAEAFGNALASIAGSMGLALTPVGDGTGTGSSSRNVVPMADSVVGPAPAAAPPPAMPAPVAMAPVPAATSSGSGRALWMVAGALAVLVVLGLGVVYVPKLHRAKAQVAAGTPPAAPVVPAVSEQPAPVPMAAATPAEAAPVKEAGKPEAQKPAHAEAIHEARVPRGVVAPGNGVPEAVQAEQQAPAAAPAPPAPAPAVQAPVQDNSAALEALRDKLNLLATRVGAVGSALDGLQREQQAQGYGLRGDILASRRRMELFMDQTENNINQGRLDAAKKSYASAEAEVEKLEAFLGR